MVSAEPQSPDTDTAQVVQPVRTPVYSSRYRQLLADGALVDRAGQPVSGASCPTCGWLVDGSTCPGSLSCPHCSVPGGRRCRRPSGHTADRWHTARIQAAAAVDQHREDVNDPSLLAPWPE